VTNTPFEGGFGFGNSGDIPIYCDWDNNGSQTVGVYRPSEAKFYVRNSNTPGAPDATYTFGAAGDIPLCGDWNGAAGESVGVYRPSEARFYLTDCNCANPPTNYSVQFGNPGGGDTPLVGNWDGNTPGNYTTTIGVWRPDPAGPGNFHLRNSLTPGPAYNTFTFGNNTDRPVVGDWDANGRWTVGITREESSAFGLVRRWFIENCGCPGTGSSANAVHGAATDDVFVWR
jgi:hypothetical protein